jgi:hypothetical protein
VSDAIEFVRNHSDLSTEKGFQFEFCCDRCGEGFRTRFKVWSLGTVSDLLGAASSLFGGVLSSAADASEHVRSAKWEQAHDGAFAEAVAEVKPEFVRCPRCSAWVCRRGCWSTQRGLCKECAPDLGVEMSAAQASRSVEEVWAHARMADDDKPLDAETWRGRIRATCPKCEAPLPEKVKFCPQCGANLEDASKCAKCGADLAEGARFCSECGERRA